MRLDIQGIMCDCLGDPTKGVSRMRFLAIFNDRGGEILVAEDR